MTTKFIIPAAGEVSKDLRDFYERGDIG